jgi:hypothetical protein
MYNSTVQKYLKRYMMYVELRKNGKEKMEAYRMVAENFNLCSIKPIVDAIKYCERNMQL